MPYRPNLKEIESSYICVLENWESIDNLLDEHKVGRKDTPFNRPLMDNLLNTWDYIDFFIKKNDYGLLSKYGGPDMLEINNRVHYGEDYILRDEYKKAIKATAEKFSKQIPIIRKYYKKHLKGERSVNKVASEVFISIVGQPQLFIEGNHRSGSIISSWINMAHDNPPFVLTVENALTFFEPAQVIKKFNKKSKWRSITKLPKYKANFREFWESHCDLRFVLKN
ncbi:hypothetical protein [Desulfopila sp. IMCC35008]|uniref:hypothetical protein n=1 Tax=Desulfopila sp. IMCC35008 TaxID=2653858 RepID=UPI0013D53B6D|nr:hypothetical protein [Desulfopila sp. IMCC35008]